MVEEGRPSSNLFTLICVCEGVVVEEGRPPCNLITLQTVFRYMVRSSNSRRPVAPGAGGSIDNQVSLGCAAFVGLSSGKSLGHTDLVGMTSPKNVQ